MMHYCLDSADRTLCILYVTIVPSSGLKQIKVVIDCRRVSGVS